MSSLTQRMRFLKRADAAAVATLLLLWLLFFWRLFTPIAADQATLARGDFSGQFVAFAGYQYQRLSQGEIPLWNPYNNGGLPFIADTQAAVFYPPRWATIGLSTLAGGWSYNALQLEMTAHVLLYSLLMYLFVRRLTLRQRHSPLAALVAAIVVSYGGYAGSYPPLQLAVLEAACWFPLGALGVLEATRARRMAWRYLALAGFALGLSWLAGHPQTSWFMTYVLVAYLAYRSYRQRIGIPALALAILALAVITIGVCAVTFFPGVEYLLQTSRSALGFDEKGNGFPLKDIAQFVFPGSVSLWSPLYIGIPSLFLVAVAVYRKAPENRFWLTVAVVGLIHSLGANSPWYHLTYNLAPGLRFFRGQERAAFVVANSLAVLVGLGVASAANWQNPDHRWRALRYWRAFTACMIAIAIGAFVLWTGDTQRWGSLMEFVTRSALVTVVSALVLAWFIRQPQRHIVQFVLIALIAFDLFSVSMDHSGNYQPRTSGAHDLLVPPAHLRPILQDHNAGQPFRVDGFRGLQDNYGSLYGVLDMRGISPLFLDGPQRIIYRDYVDNPLAWELFAVKYVFSSKENLTVPSHMVTSGSDRDGTVFVHRLENPRPYALLLYHADVVDSDEFARALMDDPRYDERDKIVLSQAPQMQLPGQDYEGMATILTFAPEQILIKIDTPANAILSLAQPHYDGWHASLNGKAVDILRAYGGLSAIEIPAGQHELQLRFAPRSYAVGSQVSLMTWLALAVLALVSLWRRRS